MLAEPRKRSKAIRLVTTFLQANARDSFSSYYIFLTNVFAISLIIFDKFRSRNEMRDVET